MGLKTDKGFSKEAFTLAEVLLTLAIIGVVAALTIPAVVTKATKQQYVTGLKKAFNTLKSVEREAIREHGAMENWDWNYTDGSSANDRKRFFYKYIVPYLDVLKDCNTAITECTSTYYARLDSGVLQNIDSSSTPSVVTSDGMAYALQMSHPQGETSSVIVQILVDINGKRGPNAWGRDFFVFDMLNTGSGISNLRPSGSYILGKEPVTSKTIIVPLSTENMVIRCNTKTSQGSGCAARVLSENGMNY